MHIKAPLAALLITASSITLAAPASYLMRDQSSQVLIDKATTQAVWKEQLPAKTLARLAKLYPVSRFGFISQVEGGFTEGKQCVVTARVMMVPRSGKSLVFDARKSATTFDAQPNLTQGQCQDLAKAKLKEAVTAVMSSLVAD